ncbi:hypothetical protein DID88_005906 [Monilinia fructigena]|uniref:C3H1-type domain-containing protein n=1 Tax=Monilinia fructigena TaxID=38457 RepID=A0A395J183_9HELO|nr:hypothetical protein DID88_005906 [Monilinia fructigena]
MMQPTGTSNYEVTINGIRFMVTKNGSKLVKAPGDLTSANATPKTALIGGVKFYRSKNGNMYREGIIKATRKRGVSKINEPCRSFTTTGTCNKGPKCRYIHDPSKVGASVIRRNPAAGDSSPGDQSSDVSSDEEDEIGSDDVDSDVIDEEFFGDEDEERNLEFLHNKIMFDFPNTNTL